MGRTQGVNESKSPAIKKLLAAPHRDEPAKERANASCSASAKAGRGAAINNAKIMKNVFFDEGVRGRVFAMGVFLLCDTEKASAPRWAALYSRCGRQLLALS
jgi:hypothetical protein